MLNDKYVNDYSIMQMTVMIRLLMMIEQKHVIWRTLNFRHHHRQHFHWLGNQK
jgi:hypothetical protein